MFDKEYFSRQMKVKRAERGWTQSELAEKSGISFATLCTYENKRSVPSFAAVIALADVFKCPTDDFWVSK